ncbi:MAG: nucleotidyl transferase AbiEii/AbiGii toxin family protein [Longimicrobiales bacterium]|nr:nucleotidyl transferase AbiEii/AbiGii toxin family protein [Longimicrobiales bacterium]
MARHVPPGSGLGTDIAVLDIAQDFLLAHLEEAGFFPDLVVLKGGTALRKFFAGSEGRFSTDLDLASREPDVDRQELAALIAQHAAVTLGPFEFRPRENRARWALQVRSEFGNPAVSIKLDIGPPCWLTPEERPFVNTSTQSRYGFSLPHLPVMRLEEILAEKVARLTRSATARDASDLVWASATSPHPRFSRERVRRLAVLKVWVDNNGLGDAWRPAISPRAFDPEAWLAPRDRWDDEQIGLLAHPPPSLADLERDLARYYGWLHDLTEEETRWAPAHPGTRGEVIAAIRSLEGTTLADAHLY